MSRFEESIKVAVPVRVAYNQWTQFEDFPKFMEGVKPVKQLDDRTLVWTASVAGKEKEWEAEITDQTPDTRIAWKSTEGAENAGAVLFNPVGPTETEVTLRIDAEPEGPIEIGRRRARLPQAPRPRRPREVQGDDRARRRQWRGLARRDPRPRRPARSNGGDRGRAVEDRVMTDMAGSPSPSLTTRRDRPGSTAGRSLPG